MARGPRLSDPVDPVDPDPSPGEDLPPEPAPQPEPQAAPAAREDASKPRRRLTIRRVLLGLVMAGLIVGVVLPVASTLIYRFIGPPVTILMIQRAMEGKGLDHRWRPMSKISPALPYAVIAAEDARFCSHHGFDFEAMEKAMANNQRRPGKIRGGSTISQQTAKNVFLWPQRSYVRKGFEAWFTVLIETLWGKQRIMEVYLNSVEWGPGIYGAEAASRHYFGVSADRLTAAQAARLAAILPSPLKWQAAKPGPYVRKRSRRIGAASGTVRRDGLAACIR
jgi:monofunctional glycosyltransferase